MFLFNSEGLKAPSFSSMEALIAFYISLSKAWVAVKRYLKPKYLWNKVSFCRYIIRNHSSNICFIYIQISSFFKQKGGYKIFFSRTKNNLGQTAIYTSMFFPIWSNYKEILTSPIFLVIVRSSFLFFSL